MIQPLLILSLFYGINIPFMRVLIDIISMHLEQEEGATVRLHATRDEQPEGGSTA
jgi:hypothetical protein